MAASLRRRSAVRCNTRFQIIFNILSLIAVLTIPLWAPAVCEDQMAADGTIFLEDCGHMVQNATGSCVPPAGALTGAGQHAGSHPDGTIKIGYSKMTVRECLPTSAATPCNTACCVSSQAICLCFCFMGRF